MFGVLMTTASLTQGAGSADHRHRGSAPVVLHLSRPWTSFPLGGLRDLSSAHAQWAWLSRLEIAELPPPEHHNKQTHNQNG